MKTTIAPEFELLTKQQLLDEICLLKSQVKKYQGANESQDIVHELQVHQIEQEMQNRELRDAQQQLEETRDSYADLYDFTPVSYINFDEKGLIKNINLTGAATLGVVRDKIIGHSLGGWLSKHDLILFKNHLQETLGSDTKASVEINLKSKSGELFEVKIESIRSKDVDTKKYLCRSILLDVTEENRKRNEILAQARQLKLITDALPLLIAYLDINERHLFANKAYVDSFGFFQDSLLGKTASEIWGESNYISVANYLKLCTAGQQIKFELELPLDDSEKKYFSTTLIPDCDSNSHVYGIIVLIGDITDRLALEALDRKRLLDISHFSRLSSMGEMASEIAHELNQPLAAISIYSDACRRMVISGKASQESIIESLTDISEQAVRAGAVIQRIREFVSKKNVQKVETDINELVYAASQLLAIEIRSHKVSLQLALEGNIKTVTADKILIEQVIFNLLRNALEAMDEIEVNKRVLKIQTSVNKSREVEVAVTDSGPGLTERQIKKIFEPFLTTKTNGMGMGLAISFSIIEAHHGRIWAVSNNGGGSTFNFTLPIHNIEGSHAN